MRRGENGEALRETASGGGARGRGDVQFHTGGSLV